MTLPPPGGIPPAHRQIPRGPQHLVIAAPPGACHQPEHLCEAELQYGERLCANHHGRFYRNPDGGTSECAG